MKADEQPYRAESGAMYRDAVNVFLSVCSQSTSQNGSDAPKSIQEKVASFEEAQAKVEAEVLARLESQSHILAAIRDELRRSNAALPSDLARAAALGERLWVHGNKEV